MTRRRPVAVAVLAGALGLICGPIGGPAMAQGQRPPTQSSPLPPLQQQQWQQEGVSPLQPNSPLPGQGGPGQGGSGQAFPGQAFPGQAFPGQAPPVAPPTVMERPNVWLPAGAAKLQALDKVNAQSSALTIKVGQSATFGSLTITVRSCMIRPADQPADAAAFLDVTDSHPDSPAFDGWLLQAEPSVSMMQHPIYDLRVTGCG